MTSFNCFDDRYFYLKGASATKLCSAILLAGAEWVQSSSQEVLLQIPLLTGCGSDNVPIERKNQEICHGSCRTVALKPGRSFTAKTQPKPSPTERADIFLKPLTGSLEPVAELLSRNWLCMRPSNFYSLALALSSDK